MEGRAQADFAYFVGIDLSGLLVGGVRRDEGEGCSTPRRVAFAAALALAFGLLPALGPVERGC